MHKVIELRDRQTGETRLCGLEDFVSEINRGLATDKHMYTLNDWHDGYVGTMEEEEEIISIYTVHSPDMPCDDVITGGIYASYN